VAWFKLRQPEPAILLSLPVHFILLLMAVEKTRLTSIPKHARHCKHFILIIIAIGLWFYWFQYRPSKIRSSCAKQVHGFENVGVDIERKEFAYEQCLHVMGLE